ncbi:hypothetical protein H2198_006020 [Neophaeococcomyces mojaviensis]|uniref:Uncharacterized protein n=1 Tax=Neophaeococcomyces mojaviensis TaxID=3383035 RepID=A0ACC3A423_9EURO|nr:hypothetical protein H2198_006020 [Knufia sp. JES_112]
MAGSRLTRALSDFALASAALAAPFTSVNEANILERRGASDICSAKSNCIPFTIDVSWGSANPTGAGARGVILTNGTLPGPALRMKVGECVDFKVNNNLVVDTGVHFHGIQQTGTPWSDGVPGLPQYAIKPGKSYMYRWTADEQGAYFYHSHYKGQIMDGLYGAIFISPADGEGGPFSSVDSSGVDKLKLADAKNEPLFVSDWSKYTFDEFYAIEQAGNVDIACADSIIINGMGSQYCLSQDQITAMSAPQIANLAGGKGYTKKACLPADTVATQGNYTRNLAAIPADVFDVCTPSKNKNYTLSVDKTDGYAALTFINTGGFSLMQATIDNHKMIVYDYNGKWTVPQTVNQVAIGNGDRVSVFVKLDQPVADYHIRVSNNGLNQLISGFGVLSYKGSSGISASSVPAMSFGGVNLTTIFPFAPAKAAPFPAETVSQRADKTYFFNIQKLPNAGHAYEWSLQSNTAYSMNNDDGTPLLYKNPSTVQESDIVLKTNIGQWIDIIMQTTGPTAQPHPIHKHRQQAQAAIPSAFNLVNPPYVDGYTTLAGENTATWTVIRYKVEVAGAWFLHCHMQTHLSGGMAVAIMDGVDKWPTVPSDVGRSCQGSGTSNSTWNPSCYCPASCPANPGKGPDGTGTGNGPSTGSGLNGSKGSGSTGSGNTSGGDNGNWNNGVWSGPNDPAGAHNTSSSGNGYTPEQQTGSYSGNRDGVKSTVTSFSDQVTPTTIPTTITSTNAQGLVQTYTTNRVVTTTSRVPHTTTSAVPATQSVCTTHGCKWPQFASLKCCEQRKWAWIVLIIVLVIILIILTICAVLFMSRRKNKKGAASREIEEEVKVQQSRSMLNETDSGEGEFAGGYTDEKSGVASRVREYRGHGGH